MPFPIAPQLTEPDDVQAWIFSQLPTDTTCQVTNEASAPLTEHYASLLVAMPLTQEGSYVADSLIIRRVATYRMPISKTIGRTEVILVSVATPLQLKPNLSFPWTSTHAKKTRGYITVTGIHS